MTPPSQITWPLVALLVAALVSAVLLGVYQVIGEDNVVRLVVGCLALIALVLRRKPPSGGGDGEGVTLLVGTAAASELGGILANVLDKVS